ncbi:MAG: GNAT family N-acetyltransferase [Methyloglobulus sp.]
MVKNFQIFIDKNIEAKELVSLMASVGWGDESNYDNQAVERSLSAYPFIAHCRDSAGLLVGYVSAFSDGAFSTFVGELVVRPEFQHNGIGTELLRLVVDKYSGVPVYATPFEDVQQFFLERGFRIPKRAMSVVSSRNALPA